MKTICATRRLLTGNRLSVPARLAPCKKVNVIYISLLLCNSLEFLYTFSSQFLLWSLHFSYLLLKISADRCRHTPSPILGQTRSQNNYEKFSTIVIIIPSERYAPQSWLRGGTLAHGVWHSKLKANQTDIALNTVFIFSPYLEMFTSSWWLTEVGRRGCESFQLQKAL